MWIMKTNNNSNNNKAIIRTAILCLLAVKSSPLTSHKAPWEFDFGKIVLRNLTEITILNKFQGLMKQHDDIFKEIFTSWLEIRC